MIKAMPHPPPRVTHETNNSATVWICRVSVLSQCYQEALQSFGRWRPAGGWGYSDVPWSLYDMTSSLQRHLPDAQVTYLSPHRSAQQASPPEGNF